MAGRRFRSHDESWEANLEAWNAITVEQLMKLIESIPKHLETVKKTNGYPTK